MFTVGHQHQILILPRDHLYLDYGNNANDSLLTRQHTLAISVIFIRVFAVKGLFANFCYPISCLSCEDRMHGLPWVFVI